MRGSRHEREREERVAAYVKPLMRVYSCLMTPPLAFACSLALCKSTCQRGA